MGRLVKKVCVAFYIFEMAEILIEFKPYSLGQLLQVWVESDPAAWRPFLVDPFKILLHPFQGHKGKKAWGGGGGSYTSYRYRPRFTPSAIF